LPLLANTVPVIFGAVGTTIKVGFADLPVEKVPVYAAILLLMPAMLLPFAFIRYLESDNLLTIDTNKIKLYWIAISAGLCFIISFIFFSYVGPDFPSILAAVIGLMFWLLLVKKTGSSFASINWASMGHFFYTFQPYLFIATLLVAGKLLLGNAKLRIDWPAIGLTKKISLFQPGLFFYSGYSFFISLIKTRVTFHLKLFLSKQH